MELIFEKTKPAPCFQMMTDEEAFKFEAQNDLNSLSIQQIINKALPLDLNHVRPDILEYLVAKGLSLSPNDVTQQDTSLSQSARTNTC